ncbi:uncharacterized protein F5147DRAFT_706977 [Suillus discolor]|uniref:C3H1-type domain-containing protein n=1 Tax=Suillus discolor TaxID=1912936 RepID=A0A9P7F3G5_9AGAM|nr:uncharacterized protein F5147DRAFT_706977 [Suillus discolor]KAG2102837.1 hypothetical protein F5147DRAFT_706977 [Suillus discolor]
MSSSLRVCYSYSQTASCRFGSQCRFAHDEGFKITNGIQTPLDDFFATYPAFDYNSSASASSEFHRMCGHFCWNKKDKEKKKAHRDFKDALVQQLNEIYGTDVNNLSSWRNLCQIVHISPIPDTLESCREAVKATHVNIVDLIDTKVTGKPVTIFVSEAKLSEYTKATRKFFPRDNAHAGGLLRYLLRRIMNPRQEHASRGQKMQARGRRRRH